MKEFIALEDRRALRSMLSAAVAKHGAATHSDDAGATRLRHACADGSHIAVEVKACFDGEFVYEVRPRAPSRRARARRRTRVPAVAVGTCGRRLTHVAAATTQCHGAPHAGHAGRDGRDARGGLAARVPPLHKCARARFAPRAPHAVPAPHADRARAKP
jgi:hypothetical protein